MEAESPRGADILRQRDALLGVDKGTGWKQLLPLPGSCGWVGPRSWLLVGWGFGSTVPFMFLQKSSMYLSSSEAAEHEGRLRLE